MATKFQEEFNEPENDQELEQTAQTEGNEGGDEPSEELARLAGWRPKDEYIERGGDPSQWREWDDFLDTEKRNGPQVRAENKLLKRKLATFDKKMRRMETDFAAAKEYYTKAEQSAYNRAVADIRKRQREAVSLADTDAFDEAEQELADLSKDVAEKAEAKPEIDPELTRTFKKWNRANDWYGEGGDGAMTAVAERIVDKVMGPVAQSGLDYDEYLEELTERVKKEFPHKFGLPKKRSAVEPVGETRATKGQETFENLPAEAKAQFKRFEDIGVPVKKDVFAKQAWDKIKKEGK